METQEKEWLLEKPIGGFLYIPIIIQYWTVTWTSNTSIYNSREDVEKAIVHNKRYYKEEDWYEHFVVKIVL